jgi:hypothetical protein
MTDGTTPSWSHTTPMSSGAAPDSNPTRLPWRAAPHSYTPRLPRHDELDHMGSSHNSEAGTCPDNGGSETPYAGVGGRDPFAGGLDRSGLVGTSYMRYQGEYILPATHLPYSPHGPAVWRVAGREGLALAVSTLLREPLERRSRGHAAAQAAAKLASGLVSTVWHVVDDMVITPALQEYVAAQGMTGAAANTQAPRVPGHPRH